MILISWGDGSSESGERVWGKASLGSRCGKKRVQRVDGHFVMDGHFVTGECGDEYRQLEIRHPVGVRSGAASCVSKREGPTWVVREKVKLGETGNPRWSVPAPDRAFDPETLSA